MDTTKAELVTRKHIMRVQELMGDVACDIIRRGVEHDRSKFETVELEPLQKMQDLIDAEGQAPYGSDEYKRRTALLGPMIEHHRANNSHHPEYYEDGIAGMSLLDLIEMICDWKAASERGEESAINLTHSIEHHGIDPQLAQILKNTAEVLGFEWV